LAAVTKDSSSSEVAEPDCPEDAVCLLSYAFDAEALGRASTTIGTIRVLPWVVIAAQASLTRSSRPWSKSLSK
jgi:hypothetical protein